MPSKLIATFYAFLILAFIVSGCRGNAALPSSEQDLPPDTINSQSDSQGHILLGYYNLVIDTETEEIEIVPVRNTDIHLNLTNIFNATMGMKVQVIPGESDFPTGLVVFDMTLTHPFPASETQFSAFDMRGIMMTPGSMDVDGLLFADHDETRVENADGYSRWWNPTEFTTPGIFGYSDGVIATGSSLELTATVNPYKLFADILYPNSNLSWPSYTPLTDPDGRAIFSAGAVNTRRYYMRFEMAPTPQLVFGYAIDCCWDIPVPNPPVNVPSDFPMTANCNEPWRVSMVATANSLYYDKESGIGGGILRLKINVHDWQGRHNGDTVAEIAGIRLMSPDLLPVLEIPPVPMGQDEYKATYISNMTSTFNLTRNGIHQVICEVISSDGTTYKQAGQPAPEVPVSAFNVLAFDVPNPECFVDTNNTWAEAEEVGPGDIINGQLCVSIDPEDYYFFTVPQGYEPHGEIRLYIDQTTEFTLHDSAHNLILNSWPSIPGYDYLAIDSITLIPGDYYIKLNNTFGGIPAPYLLDCDIEYINVIPTPVEITPPVLFVEARTVYLHGNYAFLFGWEGIWVYDVTDTMLPVQVYANTDVQTYDTAFHYPYAYFSSHAEEMFEHDVNMIDFTNVTAPEIHMKVIDIPYELGCITMNSQHIYTGTRGPSPKQLVIYDYSSNPVSPVEAGSADIGSDTPWNIDLMDPEGPATRAVLATDHDLFSFGVETPASITNDGTFTIPFGINYSIAVQDPYVYVGNNKDYMGDGWLGVYEQTPGGLVERGWGDILGVPDHLAIAGNYAYAGSRQAGIQTINIAIPSTPVSVDNEPLVDWGGDIDILGDTLATAPSAAGMHLFNLANPADPLLKTRLLAVNNPQSIARVGDYVYVVQNYQDYGEIVLLNISDMNNIYGQGAYTTTTRLYDIFKYNDILITCGQREFMLWNCSTPPSILLYGLTSTGPSDRIRSAVATKNTLILGMSIDASPNGRLTTYNITNPSSPVFGSSQVTADEIENLSVYGNYLYASIDQTMQVYSIVDPLNPVAGASYLAVEEIMELENNNLNLFVGMNNSMDIFSLAAPATPSYVNTLSYTPGEYLTEFVIDGQFAYLQGRFKPLYYAFLYPNDSVLMGESILEPNGYWLHDSEIYDDYYWEVNGSTGLRILDLY
jgi:hypothetical protein